MFSTKAKSDVTHPSIKNYFIDPQVEFFKRALPVDVVALIHTYGISFPPANTCRNFWINRIRLLAQEPVLLGKYLTSLISKSSVAEAESSLDYFAKTKIPMKLGMMDWTQDNKCKLKKIVIKFPNIVYCNFNIPSNSGTLSIKMFKNLGSLTLNCDTMQGPLKDIRLPPTIRRIFLVKSGENKEQQDLSLSFKNIVSCCKNLDSFTLAFIDLSLITPHSFNLKNRLKSIVLFNNYISLPLINGICKYSRKLVSIGLVGNVIQNQRHVFLPLSTLKKLKQVLLIIPHIAEMNTIQFEEIFTDLADSSVCSLYLNAKLAWGIRREFNGLAKPLLLKIQELFILTELDEKNEMNLKLDLGFKKGIEEEFPHLKVSFLYQTMTENFALLKQ